MVYIDTYATSMTVQQMANATGIDAAQFAVTFTRIDAPSRRRLQGAVTGVTLQNCNTDENIAFVRVVFASANYTLVSMVIHALNDKSGVLHDLVNAAGEELAECGAVNYVLSRPVNPAPSPPIAAPPPSPPLIIHINNFIFVVGLSMLFFVMANCCIVQSRSRTTSSIIDSLVAGATEIPTNKPAGKEGTPLLLTR